MKKIVLFLLVIACAFSMFGCGPRINDGNNTSGDYEVNINLVPGEVEGELKILIPSNDNGVEGRIVDVLAKGFEAKYQNKVKIRKVADAIDDEMYMDTISTLVQSNTMPDLVYTNTALYYYLVSKKVVVNLEPYFKATTEAGTLDFADYYDEYFNMALYEGKRYIMPRSADTVVTFFNTEMLKEAGIDYKTDPRMTNDWTMENFISVCEDLVEFWDTDRNKYGGYYCMRQTVFDWESVWNPLMQSFGANAYTDGSVSINSEAAKTFAEFYRTLVTKRIVPAWDSGSQARITTGTAAFEFSSWGPDTMNRYDSIKGKFDLLPFPLTNGENAKIGTGFAGWGISADSKKRDLAWAFLHYMISEEGQLALCASGQSTTPSLLRTVTEEKAWAKDFKNLNLDAYMLHPENKITPAYFKGFDPSHMFDIQYALQEFTRNCLTPSITIDNCISTAATKLTAAIKEI